MSHCFDDILNRRGNGSMKWEDEYIQKRFHITDTKDIYPLFIADMDFQMDETVKEKMFSFLKDPDLGYFHVQDSFYESVVNWYSHIHHLTIEKDWIVPSIGTITTLNLLCDMLARNENIVIMPPVYGPFKTCSEVGHTISLPLIYTNGRYDIDYDGLIDICSKQNIKVLMLCHPHNPGGRMWSQDELQKLVDICKKYHVIILVDEIHGDLQLTDKKFISMIEFADIYDQIIVSSSPNKTFNISALSTSFILCCNPQLRQQYTDYLNHLHLGCNRMGVKMIEFVYNYGQDWYKELLQYIKQNMSMAITYLKQADMEVMVPDSGYLIWVRLPRIKDVDQFVLDLAKETHVLLETGARFVSQYDGFVRINVATSRSLLEKAMKLFIDYYQKSSN